MESLLACRALNSAEASSFLNEVNSPRLAWLNLKGAHNTLIDVFTEVAMITNVPLYEDLPDQLAQIEVLKKFLISSPRFSQMHTGDIVQAFYMNEDGSHWEQVRHFNKYFSCEYLGAVLNPFLRFKMKLEPKRKMMMERISGPVAAMIPFFGADYWKTEINADLGLLMAGNEKLIFNVETKYKFIRKENIIHIRSRAHFHRWLGFTIGQLHEREARKPTKTEVQKQEKQKALAQYAEIMATGAIPIELLRKFVMLTRREIYLQHLKRAAAQGITDLFNR